MNILFYALSLCPDAVYKRDEVQNAQDLGSVE
jgi:hypothetical protein